MSVATADLLRVLAAALELPTHLLLLACAIACLAELGMVLGERFWALPKFLNRPPSERAVQVFKERVDRADLLARVGPMAGLMGTLIPLGPALSALGRGDVSALASAVTVAFDTTVLGLAIGIVGFGIGRARRRWYDAVLDRFETRALPAQEPEATPCVAQ